MLENRETELVGAYRAQPSGIQGEVQAVPKPRCALGQPSAHACRTPAEIA